MPGRQSAGAKPHHTTTADMRRFRGKQPIPVPASQRRRLVETDPACEAASPRKDEG